LQTAPSAVAPARNGASSADAPLRYTLYGARVGVPDLAGYLRATLISSMWFGPALRFGRLLGRAGERGALHQLERAWARSLCRALGVRLDVAGLGLIDPAQPYVVASLHEGMADVLALLQLPLPLRFVVRDEIFGWPAVGPYLRDTGQIEVCPERGARSYRELLRAAGAVLGGGESVAIFPQGSILGIETEFHRGAFALARALGRPILPVALTGAHRVWEHPYTPRLRFGERVSMRVFPPIPAADLAGRDPGALRDEVQRLLKAAALDGQMAAPRRFVPARDGYWDGYTYTVDPAFPELAADIARRRAAVAGEAR